MLLLALVCALITAALIAVCVVWQKTARSGPALAQEAALYEGFVADVERRVAAGDLDTEAADEERAAAARALLRAGDAAQEDHQIKPVYGVAALIVMAVASLGLYGLFGHPLTPDQPFQARLRGWTHTAQTDPNALSPQALALVLRQGRDSHAKDPAYWLFMGRIDMLAGNNYQGAQDYEKARALDPQHFTAWSELGEALTFVANGNISGDAQNAFEQAVAQDPKDARAHFYLGQQAVAQGRYEVARSHFTTALATMDAHDSSRPMVQQALDAVGSAETAAKAMQARIGGMVASLEAQLKASPDHPDGWARLIRSYNVLGDTAGQARAVQAMQTYYHDKPAVAADILARSQQAVGAENTGGM